jgi:thioredoxin-related protein
MIRKFFLITLIGIISWPLVAQEPATDTTHKEGVKWLSLEEAETLNNTTPGNFLFFIYSENCSICHKVLSETLSDTSIIKLVNNNFYPVRFASGKPGEKFIASLLMNVFQKQYFPTIIFMNSQMQPTSSTSGFQTVEQLSLNLMYGSQTKYNESMTFDEFQKTWTEIQARKSAKKN